MLNVCALDKLAGGTQLLTQALGEFNRSKLETELKLAGVTADLTESFWPGGAKDASLIFAARRNITLPNTLTEKSLDL